MSLSRSKVLAAALVLAAASAANAQSITLPDVGTDITDVTSNISALVTAWLFPGLLLVTVVAMGVGLFKAIRRKFHFN